MLDLTATDLLQQLCKLAFNQKWNKPLMNVMMQWIRYSFATRVVTYIQNKTKIFGCWQTREQNNVH